MNYIRNNSTFFFFREFLRLASPLNCGAWDKKLLKQYRVHKPSSLSYEPEMTSKLTFEVIFFGLFYKWKSCRGWILFQEVWLWKKGRSKFYSCCLLFKWRNTSAWLTEEGNSSRWRRNHWCKQDPKEMRVLCRITVGLEDGLPLSQRSHNFFAFL